jgi:hypothetical protein
MTRDHVVDILKMMLTIGQPRSSASALISPDAFASRNSASVFADAHGKLQFEERDNKR